MSGRPEGLDYIESALVFVLMFTVLVGSTRPAKIAAVVAAIETIAEIDEHSRQATIQPVDVTDVAPAMPMTDRAILDGAPPREDAHRARGRRRQD